MVNMNPAEAYRKCLYQKRRILDLESLISTEAPISYRYARDVICGRFIDGEKIIISDSLYSYLYARDVISTRWELGEKIISTNSEWSYYYARDIINGPFHLGHNTIFNSIYKRDYIDFLKEINYDLSEIGEWLI